MYHSVGAGRPPLSTPAAIFEEQMLAVEQSGRRGISLRQYLVSEASPEQAVVLTFDDGYRDLLEHALPSLRRRAWSATVFLTVEGLQQGRLGALRCDLPLLTWKETAPLLEAGWEVGSHTVSHPDLTKIGDHQLSEELSRSKAELEQRLQAPVTSFAAPYGRSDLRVRAEIARHYDSAVGTELGPVEPASDPYLLPRLEMYYFSNPERWRAYLDGRGEGYLKLRRGLRRLREMWQ